MSSRRCRRLLSLLPSCGCGASVRSRDLRRGHRRPATQAFLGLGSNMGDRLGYLRAAMRAFERGTMLKVWGASRVYETEPVEVVEEQPDYLNCVVGVECVVAAIELLRFCQGVEATLGRTGKGKKAPRTLDIDILLFGEEVLEGPDLVVPHLGILRTFNLEGLADLAPDLYIPGRGTVGELLAGANLSVVRELGEGL